MSLEILDKIVKIHASPIRAIKKSEMMMMTKTTTRERVRIECGKVICSSSQLLIKIFLTFLLLYMLAANAMSERGINVTINQKAIKSTYRNDRSFIS